MSKKRSAIIESRYAVAKERPEFDVSTDRSVYETLDSLRKEIRILLVEPGFADDPVHCTFERVSLDDSAAPCFETISYAWGDASKRGTVFLCGRSYDVPASSEVVLRRMRDVAKVRRLWLDAVCINQNNLHERSQQVAIMGKIYSKGTTNLIWLGDEDSTTPHAMASIRAINTEMRSETNKVGELKELFYPNGTMVESPTGLQVRVRASALRRFFESPWFSRVWIVQEAALSPHSVCFRGQHEISFLEVMQAVLWIRYKSSGGVAVQLSGDTEVAVNLADWTVANGGYHISRPLHGRLLAALLASFRGFQAHDPRDHVFALLGLWLTRSGTAELPPELTPDYTASLADVLRRATRFAFKERGDLEILKLLSHKPDEQRLPGLPTWTHRWDTGPGVHDPSMLVHHDRRADDHIKPDMGQILNHENFLTVSGFTVGSVATHLPELRKNFSRSFIKFLNAVEQIVRRTCQGNLHSFQQKVGITLQASATSTSGMINEQESGQAYEIYKRALANIDSPYPYHNADITKMSAEAQQQIAEEFALAMSIACYNRKFFSATGERFGLGPKTIQTGDLVTILYGSPFPVILRSSCEHANDWEIVGVCYVYGIMCGEAVEQHRRDGNADILYRIH